MVLVNKGAANPNRLLTIALKGNARVLTDRLNDKTIIIEGNIIEYKGKPEIVISERSQIIIEK